jgi:hypothetical protein
MSFMSDYGNDAALLERAQQEPGRCGAGGGGAAGGAALVALASLVAPAAGVSLAAWTSPIAGGGVGCRGG